MKKLKYIFMALVFFIPFILTSCYNSSDSRETVLKVYNWADYIDESVLEDFPKWYKEQTGEDIKIILSFIQLC